MGWQDFPMITCPCCNKESQIDDYYNFESGDEFECPECDKRLFIKYMDWVLTADIREVRRK